ncbi:MAG: T9SS type A sorting domain-containing protein [Bacteroidia bacterium]
MASSAQAVNFRILYQWFPGPGNCDTMKLFVESINTTPVQITAVNFSIVYRSNCDSVKAFSQIFSGLWGTTLEGNFPKINLPVPKTYGGISYDRRLQYGNAAFLAPGIVAPSIADSAMCFGYIVFERLCADYPYPEDQNDNSLNQWQGPTGGYCYEIIPIVILSGFAIDLEAAPLANHRAKINWSLSEGSLADRMNLFKQGQEKPIWSGNTDEGNAYSFTDYNQTDRAVYQLWVELVDGNHVPSRKIEVQWAEAAKRVDVYPIPAKNVLTVLWEGKSPPSGKLELYDIHGRVAKTTKVSEAIHEVSMDTKDLPNGNYILKWTGPESFTRKVVIAH